MAPIHQQVQHHNLFSFSSGSNSNGQIPTFADNFSRERPLIQLDNGFVEEHHRQSPPIKSEPQWNGPGNAPSFASANTKTISINGSSEVNFGTEVDILMKAI
jgi:hypothetical protein